VSWNSFIHKINKTGSCIDFPKSELFKHTLSEIHSNNLPEFRTDITGNILSLLKWPVSHLSVGKYRLLWFLYKSQKYIVWRKCRLLRYSGNRYVAVIRN
jgi:hypothetical protein